MTPQVEPTPHRRDRRRKERLQDFPRFADTLSANRLEWISAPARFRPIHDEREAACTIHSAAKDRYYAERPVQRLGPEFRNGDTVKSYHERFRVDRAEFKRFDAKCSHLTGVKASEAR